MLCLSESVGELRSRLCHLAIGRVLRPAKYQYQYSVLSTHTHTQYSLSVAQSRSRLRHGERACPASRNQ